jgi:pimeloyl-ACP methyl ester carboxylesterase
MADAYSWMNVMEAVLPDRSALVLNRRGRRPSAPLGDDYSVETEVADLMWWLESLEEPVDLVGHSYGGLIATEAVRRGASARRLVLYEPVARPFAEDAVAKVQAAIDLGDLDTAVETITVDVSGYDVQHVESLRAGADWSKLCELARPSGAELAAINAFGAVTRDYSTLNIPVTLIAGQLSRFRAPYGPSVKFFQEALGVGDVVTLTDQDHLAHVTAPAQLAHAIERGLLD